MRCSRDRSVADDLAASVSRVARYLKDESFRGAEKMVTITIRTDKISHVVSPVLEIRGTLKLILDTYLPRTAAPGPIPAPAAGSPLRVGIFGPLFAPDNNG